MKRPPHKTRLADSIHTPRTKDMKGRGIYVPPGRRNIAEEQSTIRSLDNPSSRRSPVRQEKDKSPEPKEHTKSSEKERGFYVPPARRNKEVQDITNEEHEERLISKRAQAWDDDDKDSRKFVEEQPYTPPDWTTTDHEFKDFISEEKLDSCCLVIDNYPAEASEIVRENEIAPYRRFNCEWRWITRQTCLLVFLNESLMSRAISAHSTTLHRPITLEKYQSKHGNPSFYQVGRELYSLLKPERDSRVANRLINHALGLRPQRKARPTIPPPTLTKEEETTTDAWDD